MGHLKRTYQRTLSASADEAYTWHMQPGAFQRLNPPWEDVRVLSGWKPIEEKSQVHLKVPLVQFPLDYPLINALWFDWVCQHQDIIPGKQFCDVQIRGPFGYWKHCHRVEEIDATHCQLNDTIEYSLPFGLVGSTLGELLGGWYIRQKLDRMFAYRHNVLAHDLKLNQKLKQKKENALMKVLVAGSSGTVGSSLVALLKTGGHHVVRLVRRAARNENEISWDPVKGTIEAAKLEGFDAIVNLAGESIADGYWTAEKKQKIESSRLQSTSLLANTLSQLAQPPSVFINASAIGIYGSQGNKNLTEMADYAQDFLAGVSRKWEAATQPASEKGIRTVMLRFGIILTPKGGALGKMLPIFNLGLGGPFMTIGGDDLIAIGKNYMSWIALDDVLGAIVHAITTDSIKGPVNVVAPNPVTNGKFTSILGRVMGRPTIAPVPAPMLQLVFGEMANALLLSSSKVEPLRLVESGYRFQYPELEGALRHLLGKK